MAVHDIRRTLISYNDDTSGASPNRDQQIADQLAAYLHHQGINAEMRGYSQSTFDVQAPYDWLILVYTPEAVQSAVAPVVNTALDLTVRRRMRGVLAVTPSPCDLPRQWATIRKYDASTQDEERRAVEGIWQAMHHVKTPYIKEKTPWQPANNSTQVPLIVSSSVPSRPQKTLSSVRPVTVVSLAAIVIIVTVASFLVTQILRPTSRRATLTSSSLTATAQAYWNSTFASATKTAQATTGTSTLSFARTLYGTTTKTPPTFTGFQDEQKWDENSTCSILAPGDATYQASAVSPGQYVRCMATATHFENFAYQVTMNIEGDAGGVIFRSDEKAGTFFRFALSNNPTTPDTDGYAVYLCQSDCSAKSVSEGVPLVQDQVHVDANKPVILTVIAKKGTIDLYVNGKSTYQLLEQPVLFGAIGVYAASFSNATTVTFTNLKVWQLD